MSVDVDLDAGDGIARGAREEGGAGWGDGLTDGAEIGVGLGDEVDLEHLPLVVQC